MELLQEMNYKIVSVAIACTVDKNIKDAASLWNYGHRQYL